MDVQSVKKAAKLMEEAFKVLSGGPLHYYLDEMSGAYEYMLNRFAPFKKGARVALAHTPEISNTVRPGWLGFKHFLVAGAQATVVSVDCGSAGFTFGVQFEKQTWLDREEKEHPVDDKSVFFFKEDELMEGRLALS